jgi:hypothetical protein
MIGSTYNTILVIAHVELVTALARSRLDLEIIHRRPSYTVAVQVSVPHKQLGKAALRVAIRYVGGLGLEPWREICVVKVSAHAVADAALPVCAAEAGKVLAGEEFKHKKFSCGADAHITLQCACKGEVKECWHSAGARGSGMLEHSAASRNASVSCSCDNSGQDGSISEW